MRAKLEKLVVTTWVIVLGLASIEAHADCVYGGQPYGEGSSKKQDDGNVYFCKNNSWVYETAQIYIENARFDCHITAVPLTARFKEMCAQKELCEVAVKDVDPGTLKLDSNRVDCNLPADVLIVTYHCNRGSAPIPDTASTVVKAHRGSVATMICAKFNQSIQAR